MLLEWMKPPLPWCDYHVHSWGNFCFKAPRPAVKCLDSSTTAGITTSGKNTLLPQQCCPWTAGSLHYDEFLQFKARIHFIRSHPTLIDWDSTDYVQMRKKMSQNRVSCPAKKISPEENTEKSFFHLSFYWWRETHSCFMSAWTRIGLIFVASVCPHCIVVSFKKYQKTAEWKGREADRQQTEGEGGGGGWEVWGDTHQLTKMHCSGGVCRQLIQRLWVVWRSPILNS